MITFDEDFLFGANLPWLHYGGDFGANAWRPGGGVGAEGDRQRLEREIEGLAAAGVTAVRWFLFCDGRAGIRFDGEGAALGLDEFVFRDIDAALETLERFRMGVMFVLLDFHWCKAARAVNTVQLGGHGSLLHHAGRRGALLDKVFRPVLERYSRRPSILAWDLINEPEWIDGPDLSPFFEESIALVHSCAVQPVTIGSAGARWRTRYFSLDLDFYQVHWYDSLRRQPQLDTPVDRLGFDRPVVLGEFPTLGSKRQADDILDAARTAGYAGAFYWSALSEDACSARAAAFPSRPSRG